MNNITEKLICDIPSAHSDNQRFNYLLKIPTKVGYSKNAWRWIITALINKKFHVRNEHIIVYLKHFVHQFNKVHFYYQELLLEGIQGHEMEVLKVESKRLRDKLNLIKTAPEKVIEYEKLVNDIKKRGNTLKNNAGISGDIFNKYINKLNESKTKNYILPGIRKVMVQLLGKADPLDKQYDPQPPQPILNIDEKADFPELIEFNDFDLNQKQDNIAFFKKMKSIIYGDAELNQNNNNNNNNMHVNNNNPANVNNNNIRVQNNNNNLNNNINALNNSHNPVNVNNNGVFNRNNGVNPIVPVVNNLENEEHKDRDMDMNDERKKDDRETEDIPPHDPIQQLNENPLTQPQQLPFKDLGYRNKRALWLYVKEVTNNSFVNYLKMNTEDWKKAADMLKIKWNGLMTEQRLSQIMVDNWDNLRNDNEPPLKRFRYINNNYTQTPKPNGPQTQNNNYSAPQPIDPRFNYQPNNQQQIPQQLPTHNYQQPPQQIPQIPNTQHLQQPPQNRSQYYQQASNYFQQPNQQIPTQQLHTWQQNLITNNPTQYQHDNNLMGNFLNQPNTQPNHPFNNPNTGYGHISSIREPIIKFFEKNGGISDKIQRLNKLLNTKQKQDDFILTILSSKLLYICILALLGKLFFSSSWYLFNNPIIYLYLRF